MSPCPAYLIIFAWREASAHRRDLADGLAGVFLLARTDTHPKTAGICSTDVKDWTRPRRHLEHVRFDRFRLKCRYESDQVSFS